MERKLSRQLTLHWYYMIFQGIECIENTLYCCCMSVMDMQFLHRRYQYLQNSTGDQQVDTTVLGSSIYETSDGWQQLNMNTVGTSFYETSAG